MTALLIVSYIIVNLLLTLIWWTIPAWINMYRVKYNLPSKMVIWPMTKNNFRKHDLDKSEVALLTIVGIIAASLVLIICMVCKSIYILCDSTINRIAFSKEEKVQIAVGTIEKKR